MWPQLRTLFAHSPPLSFLRARAKRAHAPRGLPDLRGLRLLGRLRLPTLSGAPFLGGLESRRTFELGIGPLLASFPESLHLTSEMLAGLDLTAHQFSLGGRNKARFGSPPDPTGETEVRAVACVGVAGTGTARLTALDVTFRERASAHGLSLRQLRSEITNTFRNFARIGHGPSLRI